MLKRHAAVAVTLAPRAQKRSFLLDDLVGMAVAGLAMGFALVTLWLAQRSSAQFGALYIMIYIMGYILKARALLPPTLKCNARIQNICSSRLISTKQACHCPGNYFTAHRSVAHQSAVPGVRRTG